MKKVLNTKNIAALHDLNENLMAPLIEILYCAKVESVPIQSCSLFVKLLPLPKTVISEAWKQVVVPKSKTKGQITFGDACNSVVNKLCAADLSKIIATYKFQSQQLNWGNYSIPMVKFDACVKKLFSDYLYTKLFDNPNIWAALKLPQLKRKVFHDNFRMENNHPAACPYCDLDTINSPGSVKIEHFLPKSKFPLLSVHPFNLLSACESCNSGGFGKGSKVEKSLASPYFEDIGKGVEFTFDQLAQSIVIDAKPEEIGVDGFLKILNLKTRYQDGNVGVQLHRRLDSLISSLSYVKQNSADILAYLDKNQGGAPFTIALNYWLRNIYFPANGI